MVSVVVLADGDVGAECVDWLMKNFVQDLSIVGVINDSLGSAYSSHPDIPYVVYKDSQQMYDELVRRGLSPDFGLLLWWPKKIHAPLISATRRGFFNTHPSLLPYNRGKHYSFWAIVESAPFGVTLHAVDEGIDTGDIVAQKRIYYDWTDTGETLALRAKEEMIKLFKEIYPVLRSDSYLRSPQDMRFGSFHLASEIASASRIDLDRPYLARDLLNILRAKMYTGLQRCWFEDGGRTFEVSVDIKERK